MGDENCLYVFLSPELEQLLLDHETSLKELLHRAGAQVKVETGSNPSEEAKGKKEVVTILLASAALIAASTPLLRQAIRTLAGRDAMIVERRLLPVQDAAGKVVLGADGAPILHWANVAHSPSEPTSQDVMIKGFGVEISIGGK